MTINASSYDTPLNFPSQAINDDDVKKKVVFCIPTISKPYQVCLDSLEASIPLIKAAGWDEGTVYQIGCPYIDAARQMMLRKALDAKATVIVFIDHDLSWDPPDLLKLIETDAAVAAGTYRFKGPKEQYMGAVFPGPDGTPIVRADGCVKAHSIPAGFLKITRWGVNKFAEQFPDLLYGEPCNRMIALFQHGVHEHVWYGEDYSFARRWNEKCGDVWIVPNLNITHHLGDQPFPGNFHQFLLRQDGGSESSNPNPPKPKES